ncbi:MAG: hypothetical protein VB021_09255 [Oscillospiraceae bacterium]|nr:hypothetical protein [Oscillospiraceae bacterium]
MPEKKPDTAKMKALVCKLPGVLSAELRLDESGALCDIHVLSDTTRAPKQTVRDVQSALAARFGVDVDHRIVSVAQIPAGLAAKNAAQRRLRYAGLDASCDETVCRIGVKLTDGAREFNGAAEGGLDRLGRYRAAAQATAAALNDCLGGRASVRLDEVRLAQLPAGAAVVCCVYYGAHDRSDLLIGSCLDRDDGGISAVRAVLDAVNRRLSGEL